MCCSIAVTFSIAGRRWQASGVGRQKPPLREGAGASPLPGHSSRQKRGKGYQKKL